MAKVNAKGRSKTARHVRRYHSLLRSLAYVGLNPNARALLEQLQMMHDGKNNGELVLSVRDAAALMGVVDTHAATRAFNDLVEHGFIRPTSAAAFSIKVQHARTWRLTFEPVTAKSQAPTNDYLQWAPAPKSAAAKRIKHFQFCNLRSGKPLQPIVNSTTEPAKLVSFADDTVVKSTSQNLQNPGNADFCGVGDSTTRLQYTMGRARNGALQDRCKTVRTAIRAYLDRSGYGSQGPLGAASGLTPSRFSRFIRDDRGLKTLKSDELDRLEAVLHRSAEKLADSGTDEAGHAPRAPRGLAAKAEANIEDFQSGSVDELHRPVISRPNGKLARSPP